jgi:hypothetical protein
MTDDIQSSGYFCLIQLAYAENTRSGREPLHDWQGNAWYARYTSTGLHLENVWEDELSGNYSHEDAHAVLLEYWRFIMETKDKQADIALFESELGYEHPCRGHL